MAFSTYTCERSKNYNTTWKNDTFQTFRLVYYSARPTFQSVHMLFMQVRQTLKSFKASAIVFEIPTAIVTYFHQSQAFDNLLLLLINFFFQLFDAFAPFVRSTYIIVEPTSKNSFKYYLEFLNVYLKP